MSSEKRAAEATRESELSQSLHRRARLALLAGLEALNRAPHAELGQGVTPDTVHRALSLGVLRFVVLSLGRARGLFQRAEDFASGRLFSAFDPRLEISVTIAAGKLCWAFPEPLRAAEPVFVAELSIGLDALGSELRTWSAELIGTLYELLLGESVQLNAQGKFALSSGTSRKQTGTFFTPRALTEVVVQHALSAVARRLQSSAASTHASLTEIRVCDPSVGGGAFLLQVLRALSNGPQPSTLLSDAALRKALVTDVVHGVDVNPIAVAVAEAALCLFAESPELSLEQAGRNLRVGDALLGAPYGAGATRTRRAARAPGDRGLDFRAEFAAVFERGGFDLVIGNPPWVAYAGRAAKPLAPARKAFFATHYASFRGYPTLQGLFVERALRLAPQGTVALVVPSSIADLDGYRAVRRVVRESHSPCEPMLEFGQDAFLSVTQPCFALIAEASTESPPTTGDERPFRLVERQRVGGLAAEVLPPRALLELTKARPFPRELFGELGFQTTSAVTQNLLRRSPSPDSIHHYPLLEGRDVREFAQGEPRLFLSPDSAQLAKARCRLRARDEYQRVRFVVRQTARYPIAALHRGLPFRNSLLAGFAVEGLPAELVVGLLNSSLYRALHLALRRDARQAAFPQVKVAHLRSLPEPPFGPEQRHEIAELCVALTRGGFDPKLAERLDAAVFGLFALDSSAVHEILAFLAGRGAARQ